LPTRGQEGIYDTTTGPPNTDSNTSVGSMKGCLALAVVAGILKGSWNASFNPKVSWCVVGDDLDYHYAWMLFQVYAAIIMCFVSIYWAGGRSYIADFVTHFILRCMYNCRDWNWNQTMGFTVVLCTLLPLLYYRIADHKTIFTPRGVVIVVGL